MNLERYQQPDVIRRALNSSRVAIVGLSRNELRASHFVGYYLARHGYDVVPVNPRESEILGRACFPTLIEVPGPIDTVNVFRDPSAAPELAEQAVRAGAKCLWLQFGVISDQAAEIATAGGLDVVMDRCMKIEHARYLGRMHWLGFNTGQITAVRKTPG